MKILVINVALRPPPARKHVPIGLGYVVSAIKRAGYEFDILDLNAHEQSDEETFMYLRTHRYDVVAMGCIVTGYKHVKQISQVIKKEFPQTVVVVGNSVASSVPEILLRNTETDIAVLGEGEETIVELLELIRTKGDRENVKGIYYKLNGAISKTAPRAPILALDDIPVPDWDLFDIEVYIRSASDAVNEPLPPIPKDSIRSFPVNTARGCPYNCTFCYHVFRNYRYRWRSAKSIIRELLYLKDRYGINYFCFHDELTFFSLKQTEAFADAMLSSRLDVFWEAACRSGLFYREEHIPIADKLKRSGCMKLSFSLESADSSILKWMNKKVGPEEFTTQVNILKRAGIVSLTSIVLGYPSETEDSIKATIDCCIANGIYPSAGYLLPQPGTPMYDYAVRQGFIRDEDVYLMSMGDRQDLRLNLTRIPEAKLKRIVERELQRCSKALGIGLAGETLLKTGFYRSPEKHQKGGES